jgi:putative ABC transport system ATP-binding protein
MLKMANVSKIYRAAEVETTALREVSLAIAAGEFLAIMGPSGCGKSTLLNVLGLLDSPSSGSYGIGFVFQSFNLIDDLSVEENVEVSLLYANLRRAERRQRATAVLERVGIAHRARHLPRQLSGGQQQRVAIARALVGRPQLILADEPTGNLDTENGAMVMAMLQQINAEGTTVVMVTHSLAHAAAAGRTLNLLDGRLVSETRLAAASL